IRGQCRGVLRNDLRIVFRNHGHEKKYRVFPRPAFQCLIVPGNHRAYSSPFPLYRKQKGSPFESSLDVFRSYFSYRLLRRCRFNRTKSVKSSGYLGKMYNFFLLPIHSLVLRSFTAHFFEPETSNLGRTSETRSSFSCLCLSCRG